MSFLVMDYPTLEQAPPGRSELSVFRGEHMDDWPVGIWAQTDGGNYQGSPGYFLVPSVRDFFIGCYWPCKLLSVILLIKAQSVFSLIHIFRVIGVNKIE